MMARGNLGAFWKDENQLSPVDRGFVSVCMLNDGRDSGCHKQASKQAASRCHKVPQGATRCQGVSLSASMGTHGRST